VDLNDVLRVAPTKVTTFSQKEARAGLTRLIDEYLVVRWDMASGPARTQRMNGIFWQMLNLVPDSQLSSEEIRLWFNGSGGDRIAALAAVHSQRNVDLVDQVADSIQTLRTPFDQYRALRCAQLLEPNIREARIRSLLAEAISNALQNGSISQEDPSRFELAKQLLVLLS
jgi:hypothetical protein